MNNWSPLQLRDLAHQRKENSFTDGDWIEAPFIEAEGIRLIQTGNVGIGRFIDSNKKYISSKTFKVLNCKEVFPGDVLICRLADPIGRACIVPTECGRSITSVDVTIFRIDEERFDKTYVVNVINTDNFWGKCAEKSGGTTRLRISRSNLGSLELFLPDFPVQRKIALILTTIDNVIEKTEALIEKHQSIKQGIMHDLFTRGVTENDELRPPYEEAPHLYKQSELGWIPREWEPRIFAEELVLRHGYQFREYDFVENGFPVVKITSVSEEGILDLSSATFIGRARADRFADVELFEGDILMSLTGNIGRCVRVPRLETKVFQNYRVGKFTPKNQMEWDRSFLYHLLASKVVFDQIDRRANLTAQANIGKEEFEKIVIPVPKKNEQQRFAAILDSNEQFSSSEQIYLRKLQNIKAGMMQDLLTGKVPVKVEDEAAVA